MFRIDGLGTIRRGSRGEHGAPPGHLYHSTFADRAWNISRLGLLPSQNPRWSGKLGKWSKGKIFFSDNVLSTAIYSAVHFSKNLTERRWSPDPILLRVDSENLKDAEQDTFQSSDWFIERPVPPDQIEVWLPWSKEWAPILEVERRVSEMETIYGEPGNLEVDPKAEAHVYVDAYFREFWPLHETLS